MIVPRALRGPKVHRALIGARWRHVEGRHGGDILKRVDLRFILEIRIVLVILMVVQVGEVDGLVITNSDDTSSSSGLVGGRSRGEIRR